MSEENSSAAPESSTPTPDDALAGVMISSGDDDEYRPLEPEEPEAKKPAPRPRADDSDDDAGETDTEDDEADDEADDDREERQHYEKLSPEQQAFVDNKVVPKITARYKSQIEQEQARANQLEQELQQYRQGGGQPASEGAGTDPDTGAPIIPKAPDPFDSDFDQKMEQRDQAIRQHAAWESQQAVLQQQQQAEYEEHINTLNKRTAAYAKSGKAHGITADDLQSYGEKISAMGGIPPEAIDLILDDKEAGTLVTKYLSTNEDAVKRLNELPRHRIEGYLEKEVRKAALGDAGSTRKPPPKPVRTDRGRGAKDEEGPPGVIYE